MSTVVPTLMTMELADLFGALDDPVLNSMNFLNEIANRYPDAISLAAGRPSEQTFDLALFDRYLQRFCRYLKEDLGQTDEQVRRTLFQYGRTKGIVHGLIADNLVRDEGVTVDPQSIVVTVGCQEAMYLVLRALRRDAGDVLFTVAPTYVGLTGAARLAELPVWQVDSGTEGVDLADLSDNLEQARGQGLRPRALYVMPDFANPSGASMTREHRQALLDLAVTENLLLLEDNPYGLFGQDLAERVPTLKALDQTRQVVYLGSFAKTALPGARVGYLIADQLVRDSSGHTGLFADELAKIKSMLTVNTSPITQAVVGGKLLDNDGSLITATAADREVYRANLRQLVEGIRRRFPDGRHGVTVNAPAGGFFVVVTVPFPVDDALLERSAAEFGVLWTPMHHFYEAGVAINSLRLSCSVVTPQQIEDGLDRLAAFIEDVIAR